MKQALLAAREALHIVLCNSYDGPLHESYRAKAREAIALIESALSDDVKDAERMKDALSTIADICPKYEGDYDMTASLSDFGGNGDDMAYEKGQIERGHIGDIARAAIAAAQKGTEQ